MNEDDLPILCQTAYVLPATATGEIMYMPGGVQTITPIAGGIEQPIKVLVDAQSAAALESQRAALAAKGKRPYFDFNHDDEEASFWPEAFFWRETPEPGIYCRGEWTADGKSKVEGKSWRQFSPVFHVDNKRGNPARIVCRAQAKPNMGGLVNDPAFHSILPLWAKAGAAGSEEENHQNQSMNEKELAALRAKNQELEIEIAALKAKESALKAKNESDALVASEIRAKEAEMKANAGILEIEALKAKNKSQGDAILARNKADAEAAVKRAVERNAIAAKDTTTQEALVAKATDDPAFISVIDAMQGVQLGSRITSGVQITREAPNATLKAFSAILARNAALPLSSETAKEKGRLARESAALFAKDIEKDLGFSEMTMEEAIKAADVTNDQVGLLAGTLVLQRSLPYLQYEFPVLGSITQDYSDAPGLFGQTENTRVILKPSVQTYDNTLDGGGRPRGWVTASAAQSVDVPVTLDEHVGVPIVFGVQTLAQTIRNLFAETAPMATYALGEYAVKKVAALITPANFNAYAANSVAGGATTEGSTSITVASTANLYPGQAIAGTGIPANTYVAKILSGTTAKMTQAATADGTGLTFTLGGGKVPITYTSYAKALADFAGSSLGEIKAAFDTNEVPMQNRFTLLNALYHQRLSQDPALQYFFAMRRPEAVTDGQPPKIQGFTPVEAPWFPSSGNRVGFAGHKASLILKTRLPNDFTSAVGAMTPGSVTTVTTPGGISVLLVQYVNLQGNYAEWRPEVMLGAAVGDRRCGLVLTSQ